MNLFSGPTHEQVIHELVEDLDQLSVLKLRALFKKEGIKGKKQDLKTCPVATYIKKKTGVTVCVSTSSVWSPIGSDPYFTIPMQYRYNLKEFIHNFDLGKYPSLEIE